MEAYEGNSTAHQDRKSLKQAEVNKELDEPLYEWFVNNRALNKTTDSATLLTTGKRMVAHMKLDVNRVDELWLQRWRAATELLILRHTERPGIVRIKMHKLV